MSQLLIASALLEEIRDLKGKLATDCTIHFKPAVLRRGLLFGREVNLLATGIGAKQTHKALTQVLSELKTAALLFVGFAGSTSPLAKTGALILGEKVVDTDTGESFMADADLLAGAKEACKVGGLEHHVGGMATVGKIICNPHEKASIGILHNSLALDMEVAVAAKIAKQQGIPFLAVKAVLDPLEMELPDLKDCIDDEGGAKPLMLMGHLVKTPGDMMKLPQLQYCASQARESINQFVEAYLRSAG